MERTGDLRDPLTAPAYGWWEPLHVPPRGDPRPFTLQSMEIKYTYRIGGEDVRERHTRGDA